MYLNYLQLRFKDLFKDDIISIVYEIFLKKDNNDHDNGI